MLSHWCKVLAATAMVCVGSQQAAAQELEKHNFKVLGTWNTLTQFNDYEKPFWTEWLPEASNGALTGDIVSMSVMGLGGYETLNLLKRGVFDFGHITIGYVTGNVPAMEMMDMPAVATDMDMARLVADTYAPALADQLAERQNAILLASYPFSSAFILCNAEIKSISDLKGKKIRTYSAALADFITGLGGVSVTIPFAEIAPALEKGVADCAITGAMSAYQTKLQEVTTHVYNMPATVGMVGVYANKDMWDRLDDTTRTFLTEQIEAWENRVWDDLGGLGAEGIVCLTGTGECDYGEPGDLTLVPVSAEDDKIRLNILRETVIPNWLGRCGEECKEPWNASAGKEIDLIIE